MFALKELKIGVLKHVRLTYGSLENDHCEPPLEMLI